jgi:hypothetical protein
MQQQVRARQRAAPGLPVAVSLDWLNRERSRLRAAEAPAGWNVAQTAAFARACREVAALAKPICFDVAPEVNVYLARHPEQLGPVRALVREARRAIQQVSPDTVVVASFNVEVLRGEYGRTEYVPYGRFPVPNPADQAEALTLFEELDAVGLTSAPETIFKTPAEIPGNYLLGAKAYLGDRPVALLQFRTRVDPKRTSPELQQAAFLRRLLQVSYWLEAAVVAYPDAVSDDPENAFALRTGDRDRPAATSWEATLAWKRVQELTANPAEREAGSRPGP